MTDVTFGRVDQVLRSLGFVPRDGESPVPARWYNHQATGAIVVLPAQPFDEHVQPYHLLTIRAVVQDFGIVDDRSEIEALFRKAG